MISAGVTVVGSFGSVEGTTGSTTGPTNWWTCHLIPRTGSSSRTRSSSEIGDLVAGSRRTDGADRFEVGEVGIDDGHHVDVVEDVHALAIGLTEDEPHEAVFVGDGRRV